MMHSSSTTEHNEEACRHVVIKNLPQNSTSDKLFFDICSILNKEPVQSRVCVDHTGSCMGWGAVSFRCAEDATNCVHMLSTSLDHIVCGRRHVYAELVPPQVQFDTLFRRKKNRVIVHEEKERILQNIVDPEKITAFIEPPPKRLKKDLHQHGVVSFFPKKRLAEDLFIPNGVSAPPVHPYLAAWFEGIEDISEYPLFAVAFRTNPNVHPHIPVEIGIQVFSLGTKLGGIMRDCQSSQFHKVLDLTDTVKKNERFEKELCTLWDQIVDFLLQWVCRGKRKPLLLVAASEHSDTTDPLSQMQSKSVCTSCLQWLGHSKQSYGEHVNDTFNSHTFDSCVFTAEEFILALFNWDQTFCNQNNVHVIIEEVRKHPNTSKPCSYHECEKENLCALSAAFSVVECINAVSAAHPPRDCVHLFDTSLKEQLNDFLQEHSALFWE